MTTAIVHLVRHGQVDNPEGILYGRLPGFHLSGLGQRMAQRVAEVTADWELAWLGSSPLERARETLEPIAERRPHLVRHVEARVFEAGSRFEGAPFSPRRILTSPRKLFMLRNPLRPSWGEPYVDIATRMTAAIADIGASLGDGEQALVVSHQLPIWIARLHAEGKPYAHLPNRRECSLASITTFEVVDGAVLFHGYRETCEDMLDDASRRSPISTSGAQA